MCSALRSGLVQQEQTTDGPVLDRAGSRSDNSSRVHPQALKLRKCVEELATAFEDIDATGLHQPSIEAQHKPIGGILSRCS